MELFDLSNEFEINSSFQRSARIDNALSESFITNYIFHDTSRAALNRIANSFKKSNQCSFTLTGPYGSGKSSLLLFLSSLLSQDKQIQKLARSKVGAISKQIYSEVFLNSHWFVLKIIGAKENSLELIASSIDENIKNNWISKNIPSALKTRTRPKTDQIIKKLENIAFELDKKGFGLLMIIDELGRVLEYASNTGGDLHLFQEIAENFSKNKIEKKINNIFISILHQPFEEYASALGRNTQEEWQKIQGRFEDIPFSIGSEESVNLIARAINKKNKLSNDNLKKIGRISRSLIRTFQSGKISNNDDLEQSLNNCFPLHPLTSVLLGPISRNRFGQNERSIFTFLNSGEPHGFLYFLKNNNLDKNYLYGLDNLFDYLQANLESSILVSPIGHNWAEASEAIRRSETTDNKKAIKLAKAIALLDIFGKSSSLNATKDILYDVLEDTKSQIDELLTILEDKKIIIYRKFKKAFSLFSGSDINIDEAVEQNKAQISGDYQIILSQIPELPPVIAKKHLHQFGSLRLFKKHCLFLKSVKDIVNIIYELNNSEIATGTVILLLRPHEDSEKQFLDNLKLLCSIKFNKPTIIGYSQNTEEFLNLAHELAALKRAKTSLVSLESDLVAKKEIEARLSVTQNLLYSNIDHCFNIATWFFHDKNFKNENLSAICSEVSNLVFYNSPTIINELVNREKISGSATTASNVLINKILKNSEQKDLGMEGAPAEFGIYLSIIKSNSLHVKKGDSYKFVNPDTKNVTLFKIFNEIKDFLAKQKNPISLLEIYNFLKQPPFGIKSGILPILITCFYKANEDKYALYEKVNNQSESFITEFTEQIADKFCSLPDEIKIMFVQISGAKNKLLEQFKKYVEKEILLENIITDVSPLAVLKPIVIKTYKMSGWARKTRRFKDKRVLQLREELLSSRNPYQLLYSSLPEICINKTLVSDDITEKDINDFIENFKLLWSELNNAHKEMIREFKDTIVRVFKSDPNIADINFDIIKKRAQLIGEKDPFSEKVSKFKSDDEWIEHLAGYSIGKPVDEWVDQDFSKAQLNLEEMVRHFIMTDRLYTIRDKYKDSKIVDIAIFEGKNQQRASKFYFSTDIKNNIVDETTKEIQKLMNSKNLSDTEKGEITLKVLKELMVKNEQEIIKKKTADE